MQQYDFIGDIHGHSDALKRLLTELGYKPKQDNPYCYKHPEGRKVIFLGDYIDRGPGVMEVLRIVHAMMAAGEARGILGNHEFNMIGHYTLDEKGNPLRPFTEKNLQQTQATRQQAADAGLSDQEWEAWIQWMRQLPLWLEGPGFRAVHAAWDFNAVQYLRRRLLPDHSIGGNDQLLWEAWQKGEKGQHPTPAFSAMELLLKGREIDLPLDEHGRQVTYPDKEGYERDNIRTRWWEPFHGQTYTSLAFPPQSRVKNELVPEVHLGGHFGYPEGEPPVFVGHYWLNLQDPDVPLAPLAPNVACLDYSVAKQGYLVAYRWNGEQELHQDRMLKAAYQLKSGELTQREA
jgi:hypothetical protein